MYCINCGNKNDEDAKFCLDCGTQVQRVAQTGGQTPNYYPAVSPKPKPEKAIIITACIVAVVAIVVAIVIATRGSSLVGRWYHIGYTDYGVFEEAQGNRLDFVEFFSNGNFIAGSIRDGNERIDEDGSWETSGNRLFIRTNWSTDSVQFRIRGSRFYIYDGPDYTMVYSRNRPRW